MHDIDILDNGYLAKRDVASSWRMRQFLIPLLTLKPTIEFCCAALDSIGWLE